MSILEVRHPCGQPGPPSEDQTTKPSVRRLDDVILGLPFPGMVGRGGLEPPTSRLSGVRSNHLSYRPVAKTGPRSVYGGAYRDRTDDLLNANQALSQLS